jgi:NAD(P)-dependent dehydrogenase (short-subunit alcohol dehydrogenase family)
VVYCRETWTDLNRCRRGLGEIICIKFAKEGCNIALNYLAAAERARQLAEKIEKEYGVKVVVIQGVSPS